MEDRGVGRPANKGAQEGPGKRMGAEEQTTPKTKRRRPRASAKREVKEEGGARKNHGR